MRRRMSIAMGVTALLCLTAFLLYHWWTAPTSQEEIVPPVSVDLLAESTPQGTADNGREVPAAGGVFSHARTTFVSPPQTAANRAPESQPQDSAASSEGQGNLSISGRVLDVDKNPLSGVEVSLSRMNVGTRIGVPVITGPDGAFVFTGLQAGSYVVMAIRPGGDGGFGVSAEAGQSNADITMPPRVTISGVVTDSETSRPIQDFTVYVSRGDESDPLSHLGNGVTFSDPQGRFRLPEPSSVFNGTMVAVSSPGYVSGFSRVSSPYPDAREIEVAIALSRGRRVQGVVVDATGQNVAYAAVFAAKSELEWQKPIGSSVQADAEGAFELDDIPSQDVVISATHPGYFGGYTTYPASAPDNATLQIQLRAGGGVRGRVTVDGAVSPRTAFVARDLASDNWTAVNADGTYEISGLPAGTIPLMAGIQPTDRENGDTWDSRWHWVNKNVTIVEGEMTELNFDLESPRSGLEGRVTVNGQPVIEGNIWATSFAGEGFTTARGQIEGNGFYRFDRLPAGKANLWVGATDVEGNFHQKVVTVSLTTGVVQKKDVDFVPGVDIIGKLGGTNGVPFAAAIFGPHVRFPSVITRAELNTYQPETIQGVQVDGDGSFRLKNVEPGRYVLHCAPVSTARLAQDQPLPYAMAVVEVKSGQDLEVALEVQ